MEILIISGLSGGGKSKAASFLEDMGFYIVDNMPAGMILKFAEFCAASSGRYNRVVLVYDVRTADSFDEFLSVLETLRAREYNCRLLFLEADVKAIINRYKETRRLHPLQEREGSLQAAVDRLHRSGVHVQSKGELHRLAVELLPLSPVPVEPLPQVILEPGALAFHPPKGDRRHRPSRAAPPLLSPGGDRLQTFLRQIPGQRLPELLYPFHGSTSSSSRQRAHW